VDADKEQRADTRIISAANRDPAVAVLEKRLREDLFYRLNVVPIQLPPLRERDGDIPLLVHLAISQLAKKHNKQFKKVHWKVLEILTRYDWPGNVRQLMHALERIIVMHNGEVIEQHMLPEELLQAEPSCLSMRRSRPNGPDQRDTATKPNALGDFASKEEIVPLEDLERRALSSALELCDGSAYEAARRLNVSTATIYRKIKLFNLRGQ
jgi:transcriptional regulator with PAS, ATPase and Fis domain